MDYWLLDLWNKLEQPPMQYIPIDFFMAHHGNNPTPAQIAKYRNLFGLPDFGPCPLAPKIAFLLVGRNHYCSIVIRPEQQEIHVLGRGIKRHQVVESSRNWETWGGDRMWDFISALHGWERTPMTVKEVHWPQNGYDCGPIACQVIEHILTSGFNLRNEGTWILPKFPCCHHIRARIVTDVQRLVDQAIDTDMELINQHEAVLWEYLEDVPTADELQEYRRELNSTSRRDAELATTTIKNAMRTCPGCMRLLPRATGPNGVQANLVSAKPPKQNQIPPQQTRVSLRLKGSKKVTFQADNNPEPSTTDGPEDEMSVDEDMRPKPNNEDDSPASRNKPYHVKDWSQARLGRFPRPFPPVDMLPKQKFRTLRLPDDSSFDDYETGATLEELDPISDTIIQLASASLTYIANKILTVPWETYKDYGWRIQPSFFQTFDPTDPILVAEHTIPNVVTKDALSQNMELEWNDTVTMGLQDMISEARSMGNNDLFLNGKTRDGHMICVDVAKDSINLASQQIAKSCDIDSFIWITKVPRFKKAVEVFVSPVIRRKAPIWKHNHMYVTLLLPQSEEDRMEFGSRTEWEERRFSLSRIPHISFGRLGGGSSSANLLLFLPRMAHQAPYSNRWVSLVPSHIQNLLWDSIIRPAMRTVSSPMNHPYVGLNQEHIEFKQGRGSHERAPAAYPFGTKQFMLLIKEIQRLASDIHPLHTLFNVSE